MPNPFQLTIRPGHHSMELMAGGEVRARWEFDAAGGARLSHAFRYEPPVVVSARRPSKTLPWVTIAVGAAGLAAGTITGALALGHLHSLNGECAASGACPPSSNWQSDKSAANTFANVSTYTLIGGGVVAAAGIVWLIVATVSPPSSGATTGASGGGSCMGRGCDGTLQFRF
jgi:hypothetical protein